MTKENVTNFANRKAQDLKTEVADENAQRRLHSALNSRVHKDEDDVQKSDPRVQDSTALNGVESILDVFEDNIATARQAANIAIKRNDRTVAKVGELSEMMNNIQVQPVVNIQPLQDQVDAIVVPDVSDLIARIAKLEDKLATKPNHIAAFWWEPESVGRALDFRPNVNDPYLFEGSFKSVRASMQFYNNGNVVETYFNPYGTDKVRVIKWRIDQDTKVIYIDDMSVSGTYK